MAAGFLLIAAATAGLCLVAAPWGPHGLVFVLWFLGGCGVGLAVASTSVRVLALSPESRRGFHFSALQISDMLGQAVLVGLGGVLVTALAAPRSPTVGVVALNLLLAALALLAAALVRRSGGVSAARSPIRSS